MNREKITRLERIKKLEEKNLDQIVVKLKQVNQTLAHWQKHQMQVASRHNAVMQESATSVSIQQLESMRLFSNSVETRSVQIQEQIDLAVGQRTELLDEVAACRSKIKGWQSLIEKLHREDADFLNRVSMLEADDRVLRDLAINGSKR